MLNVLNNIRIPPKIAIGYSENNLGVTKIHSVYKNKLMIVAVTFMNKSSCTVRLNIVLSFPASAQIRIPYVGIPRLAIRTK